MGRNDNYNQFLRDQLDLLCEKRIDKSIEWKDVADLREQFFHEREHIDTCRKGSKLLFEYIQAGWVQNPDTKENALTNAEIIRLKKDRMKLSDEKSDFNRQIRREARKESFLELVQRYICENTKPIKAYALQENKFNNSEEQDSDLLCHLTDIHTGIEIDTWCNVYNEHVLEERVQKYFNKIVRVKKTHNATNCYIVIGEILSGIIHNNLRLQNNMDLMQQFKFASNVICKFLIGLSVYFKDIYIYITQGNHSRISPKKEDALDGENMDNLLPFYLKAALSNYPNLHVCENPKDPEIAMMNIRGVKVFSAHGHKDTPESVVQNYTMMFGEQPDMVLLGHRHENAMKTVHNTKVVSSGCVCGADQHAQSIRKNTKAEQTICVITDDGFDCLYDIQLG